MENAESESMDARTILEVAKATGRIEFLPYHTLFTREFFNNPGRIIEIGATHLLRIIKPLPDDELAPFVFVFSNINTGKLNVGFSDTEEQAVGMIESILAIREIKNLECLKDWQLSIPDFIQEKQNAQGGVMT